MIVLSLCIFLPYPLVFDNSYSRSVLLCRTLIFSPVVVLCLWSLIHIWTKFHVPSAFTWHAVHAVSVYLHVLAWYGHCDLNAGRMWIICDIPGLFCCCMVNHFCLLLKLLFVNFEVCPFSINVLFRDVCFSFIPHLCTSCYWNLLVYVCTLCLYISARKYRVYVT